MQVAGKAKMIPDDEAMKESVLHAHEAWLLENMVPIFCASSFDLASALQESLSVVDVPSSEANEDFRMLAGDATPTAPVGASQSPSQKRTAPPLSDSHRRRKRVREGLYAANGHEPRQAVMDAHLKNAQAIETPVDLSILPSTLPAYTAKREMQEELAHAEDVHAVPELVGDGFQYVTWDGETLQTLVAGDKKTVFGAMVGQPKGDSWREAVGAVTQLLVKEGAQADFTDKERHHRRGHFPAVNVGTTHAQGSEEPFNLNNKHHTGMVERLLADKNVQRVAAFASASFRLVVPKVYKEYKTALDKLFEKMPGLCRIFEKSVYPACAFNFGPRVCTSKHRDILNCPYGMCAIQALGHFDPTKGGHIILWEAKLIIEFPPGAVILIPSAVITHSNIPVCEGETRFSFTQYCAGGLLRYVDHGFRLERDIKKTDKKFYAQICQEKPGRWKKALSLLSTLSDLKK